ncbi:MarR family winged helix-turn-helix transcriptional regulator [Salidesulfovibrio brasiliensis]|uniref:MarR family winged helix-turn-helix transcriptional regulator n=1 Tax=Salidesulfovibrio brasiliensis TaxID=221711 RepID=UPI0006D1793F|nr:MarR family transcriptional regulator [Salidesulfovibrio brasiliensis]
MADDLFTSETDSAFLLQSLDRLSRLNTRCLSERLKPYGCAPGYTAILDALAAGDGITQKELLDRLSIEQPTLSKSLDRMERDGILTRSRDDRDRRRLVIRLEERGKRLISVVSNARKELDTVASQGLTINDIRYFKRISRQIAASLEQDADSPLLVLADVLDE